MADLADVERALVGITAGALFPTAYVPGAYATTTAGQACKIYRGWPTQESLVTDVVAGKTHVSVFAEGGMTRNVTRWWPEADQVSTISPTVSAAVSGVVVTLSGTITASNVAGIQAGLPAKAYAYIIQAGDTLATVAAVLAGKIPGATSTGPAITMPSALGLRAATMTPQTVLTITRQQQQGFRISIWAPDPHVRDAIAGLVDGGFSGLKNALGFPTRFFSLGTYEVGRLEYRTTYVNDMPARDRVWRRDLCYTVEYSTSLIEQDPVMLFGGGTINSLPFGATLVP